MGEPPESMWSDEQEHPGLILFLIACVILGVICSHIFRS